SNDQALQPVRIPTAKIRHVTVIGADQPNFERRVIEPDEAHERAGDQKMDVRPLVVHVLDAVLGLIILHPRPGVLAAPPLRVAAGKAFAGCGLPEYPPVVFSAETVVVAALAALLTIGCQF